MMKKEGNRGIFCVKEDAVIKKISLNLFQGLQRLLFSNRLCNNGERGRCRNKFGNDTHIITIHGFTLIELLVVVLIIGILAAVALPQYNKAVKKAQGTEALAALDAVNAAVSAYYLENNSYAGITEDTLSIKIPQTKHFRYNIGTGANYASSYSWNGDSVTFQGTNTDGQTSNSSVFMTRLCDRIGTCLRAQWKSGSMTKRFCSPTYRDGAWNHVDCEQYVNCLQWNNNDACEF